MATLSTIVTNILTKLEEEAGSQEWWIATEITGWFNDLYIDICREGDFNRTRDISTGSVAEQSEYNLPVNALQVLGMTYNGKPIYPTTIKELNAHDRNWRSRGSGTPIWYYFEEGKEYTEVSLFPKPDTSEVEIGFDVAILVTALDNLAEPIKPFEDGLIIRDGVISIALAKEGEGQNIERSNYYWSLFAGKLTTATKRPKMSERVHVLRSIEDGGIKGLNLGDHYEPYVFS